MVNRQMVKQIEETIVDLLKEYGHSGLNEEYLFNYVVGKLGTLEKPLPLRDYEAARANLSERIVEKEIVMANEYSGNEMKVRRFFLIDR